MLVIAVLTSVILVIFTYYTGLVSVRIMKSGQVSPAAHIPMWIPYATLPLGFFGGILRQCEEIIKIVKTPAEELIRESRKKKAGNCGGHIMGIGVLFIGLLVLLFTGVPIMASLLGGASFASAAVGGQNMLAVVQRYFTSVDSFSLIAVAFLCSAARSWKKGRRFQTPDQLDFA